MLLAFFEDSLFKLKEWILLFFQIFIDAFEALGDLLVVGKDEFEIKVGGIAQGVDAAFGVWHGGIGEYADDVSDSVNVAQRGEALTHAFLLNAGEIDILHRGISDFFWMVELGEFA